MNRYLCYPLLVLHATAALAMKPPITYSKDNDIHMYLSYLHDNENGESSNRFLIVAISQTIAPYSYPFALIDMKTMTVFTPSDLKNCIEKNWQRNNNGFVCNYCGQLFVYSTTLHTHIGKKHTEQIYIATSNLLDNFEHVLTKIQSK